MKPLCEKFIHEGFNVLEAKNGEEGLEISLREHPDLILSDIVMLVMDEMTMLSKIRADEWGKTAKAIVLANLGGGVTVAQNSYDYLVKSDWKIEDAVARVRYRLDE